MKRRQLFQASAAATASAGINAACRNASHQRPNLLVLCVDDLNTWVNHLNPQQQILTPWIDRLAQRGTVFERTYCAAPYCNASRMAVFTGCWPSTTGVYKDQPYWSQPQRKITYLEAIRRQGYSLFSAGKVLHGRYNYKLASALGLRQAPWIQLEDRDWLWDQNAGIAPEPLGSPFPSIGLSHDTENRPWTPQFDWGVLSAAQEARHPDVRTADAMAAFLRQTHQRPFLAIAGFYKPHLPWYAPQRWLDRYPLSGIELPPQFADDLNDVPPTARTWAGTPADEATLRQEGLRRQALRAYKASISFADEQIGRVLKALWSSPLAENTIVALWSDNGFHLGEKLHWRKFTLWEEATRVPMIIADPLTGPYKPRVAAPVSLIDLFPTLVDLAGLQPLAGVDGHSLQPVMRGEANSPQTPVLMSWGAGNHSLRQGSWRYTSYAAGGAELYNHSSDPLEHRNLSGQATTAKQEQLLRRKLAQSLGGSSASGDEMEPSNQVEP